MTLAAVWRYVLGQDNSQDVARDWSGMWGGAVEQSHELAVLPQVLALVNPFQIKAGEMVVWRQLTASLLSCGWDCGTGAGLGCCRQSEV